MDWVVIEILSGLVILTTIAYFYFTANHDYWIKRGVLGPKPIPILGNFKDILLNKISVGDYLTKLYKIYKDEPVFGVFDSRTPILVIKDSEYIKDVLIKDFTTFANRAKRVDEKTEPLSQHLFFLEVERWRPLRQKLSPIFTTGKLKEMFYLLVECADHFELFLEKHVKKNLVIDCRELTARFTTDVIGVCAFGLKMNAIAEEESSFRRIGRQIFERSFIKILKFRTKDSMPWLYKFLNLICYNNELNSFFINMIRDTMKQRRESNVKRNDFVDLLMAIKDDPSKIGDFQMTDSLLTAQAFVFFVAGFETSSTTMSNALYELALNQTIQDQLRKEIFQELDKNNGQLKYESIKNMVYMHKVFSETLRKHPPVVALVRYTTASYTFSDLNLTIPKEMRVLIPVYAIHHDPEIYPSPDTFDPERFTDDNVKQRHPCHYLSFGDGPRNCIGARFANYQTKVGLIKILKNYKIEVCEQTCIPYVNDPKAFLLSPVGGIKLKFTKIN